MSKRTANGLASCGDRDLAGVAIDNQALHAETTRIFQAMNDQKLDLGAPAPTQGLDLA